MIQTFGSVLQMGWAAMQYPIVIDGFTFTMAGVMIFGIIASLVGVLIGGMFK